MWKVTWEVNSLVLAGTDVGTRKYMVQERISKAFVEFLRDLESFGGVILDKKLIEISNFDFAEVGLDECFGDSRIHTGSKMKLTTCRSKVVLVTHKCGGSSEGMR